MNYFEIYFADLTPDAQKRFLDYMGLNCAEDGNYDVFPIDIIDYMMEDDK